VIRSASGWQRSRPLTKGVCRGAGPRTIEILSVDPFPADTSRTITQAALFSHSSILRKFGLMEHLLVAVVRELSEQFAKRAAALPHAEIAIDGNTVLLTRLLAWLFGECMNPPSKGLELKWTPYLGQPLSRLKR